jgi:cell wall-associated NlpC family hydrolase
VKLRGAATKAGWQRVYCGSTAGYVVGEYLSNVSQSSNGGTSSGGGGNSSSSAKSAKVSGTGGAGVRLRAKASTSSAIVAVVPEGATVKIRSGSTGSWTAVSYNGSNGFIHKDFLKVSGSSSPSTGASDPTPTPSSGALAKGDRAKTTANLNLRYSASSSAGIAAVAPSGTVVKITGSLKSGFYAVDWDGLAGYMSADYLTKTSAALSTRGGSSGGNSGGGNSGGNTGGNSGGDSSIVDFAMQYLGYPYVWATAGPSSFDCSGFTYWVVKNTLGTDIGRGLFTQAALGTPISRNSLQPGDLVFFQNTYTWGLSHVGIYIGNDQFVHAQNESTGVVVSDLNSTYYASRWYGAVRL